MVFILKCHSTVYQLNVPSFLVLLWLIHISGHTANFSLLLFNSTKLWQFELKETLTFSFKLTQFNLNLCLHYYFDSLMKN